MAIWEGFPQENVKVKVASEWAKTLLEHCSDLQDQDGNVWP